MLAICVLCGCGRNPDLSKTIATTAGQVRRLASGNVQTAVPARIQGVLTYSDRLSSDCFVQDSTGGLQVGLAAGQTPPLPGSRVEISGASVGGSNAGITQAIVRVLGPGVLPPSIPLSPARLREPALQDRLVAIGGVVRSARPERPGLVALEVRAGSETVLVRIPASPIVFNEDWVDTEVRATGVLSGVVHGAGDSLQSILWVAEASGITVQHPRPAPAGLPVTTIRALLAVSPSRMPNHRVHVRGVSYASAPGGGTLMDESGQIPVHIEGGEIARTGVLQLDVVGFLNWEHGRAVLDQVWPVSTIADRSRMPAAGTVLTTAQQVRALTPEAAKLAFPVHLRAQVTYFDGENHLLFVQDRTDAIFVELNDSARVSPAAGDEVEVIGVSTADFAPDVASADIRVIRHGTLPEPSPGTFESAIRGRQDCHWIELGGIVRRVARGGGDSLLTIAWGRDTYKAHVLAPPESLSSLVDAEVKLRGVCGALFNPKHQMLGIQMFVPDRQCIRVVRSPLADPFNLPPTSIKDLMQFSDASDLGHRVRLHGTVTYPNRGGSTWIRDDTGGVMLQDHAAAVLNAGDQVDVVGFPVILGYSPALHGALVRKSTTGPPPNAVAITAHEAVTGGYDGQLVQLDGKLIDRLQQPAELVLMMESGGIVFNAHLPHGREIRLERGAVLRLTGICSVETEQSQDLILPRAFRLFLRSPADVAVLSLPPWLTVDRVVPILAGALLLVLAALAWAALLRKRVRTQTRALHAQTIQLQAAHQRTCEALQKACEAEALDADSKRIVELIARDEPVNLIVDHIAEAVSLHSEAAACVILLRSGHSLRVCAVPQLPADWMEILGRLDFSSISLSPEFRGPSEFSDDAAWENFVQTLPGGRFKAFCSAPIVVDSATVGVIVGFYRQEMQSADAQSEMLALWCNVAALALDRRRLHDQLSYRAQHDTLTGLPNRALLYERLESAISSAAQDNSLLGLLYIDLDGFKLVNDTHGHDAGDAVLQEAARRMVHGVRHDDTVARIGGDEFAVLLPHLAHREDAEALAAKLAAALKEPISLDHHRLSVGGSVGISIWPMDGGQPDALLRFADAKMYGAKRRRWYDPSCQRSTLPEAAPVEAAKS